MCLLSIANKNFYILMFIVVLILFFYGFKGCNQKKDRIISKILMTLYVISTFVVFVLTLII